MLYPALLFGASCRNRFSSLAIEIQCVLFVEVFQLVRSWVRTRDVKLAVLQEIIIGVSAAGLAPACELPVALGYQRHALIFG